MAWHDRMVTKLGDEPVTVERVLGGPPFDRDGVMLTFGDGSTITIKLDASAVLKGVPAHRCDHCGTLFNYPHDDDLIADPNYPNPCTNKDCHKERHSHLLYRGTPDCDSHVLYNGPHSHVLFNPRHFDEQGDLRCPTCGVSRPVWHRDEVAGEASAARWYYGQFLKPLLDAATESIKDIDIMESADGTMQWVGGPVREVHRR